MQIRLLSEGYKESGLLYQDFIADNINETAPYFSEEVVYIEATPDFPIYMGKGSDKEKKNNFFEAISVLKDNYIHIERDLHFNEQFWHSFLVGYKRDYIASAYPEIMSDKKNFNNIVLKKFDWENYIYKCILAAEYIYDADFKDSLLEDKYVNMIYDNLDIYNYIIKYEIFRNAKFLINLLTIIEEEGLKEIFKKKIKDRPDLGNDERYGRRVIFELNKNYPVVLTPFMEKDDLKQSVMRALSLYYDIDNIQKRH